MLSEKKEILRVFFRKKEFSKICFFFLLFLFLNCLAYFFKQFFNACVQALPLLSPSTIAEAIRCAILNGSGIKERVVVIFIILSA